MYYTVIIQNDNTQAIFAYATLNEAKAKYHSELYAESRTSTKCAILLISVFYSVIVSCRTKHRTK